MSMKRGRTWGAPSSRSAKRAAGKKTRRSVILKTIKSMAEQKREHMYWNNDVINHDAGSGTTIGGYGRVNDKRGQNWLGLLQGDGVSRRDGNSVYSQYVDYKFQLHGTAEWPSQAVRIIIYTDRVGASTESYTGNIASLFVKDGTAGNYSGNLMVAPVDKFAFNILRDFVVYPLKRQMQGTGTANGNGMFDDYTDAMTGYASAVTALEGLAPCIVPGPCQEYYAALLATERAALTASQLAWDGHYLNELNNPNITADDAGNDTKYPVVSGRIKTNRKIQYKNGTQEFPMSGKDKLQVAFIPYADPGAALTDNVCRIDGEIVHYFKDF